MVSMQKVFFFSFPKSNFSAAWNLACEFFSSPKSQKSHYLHNLQGKKKNCSEYLQCSFILSLKNKNLLFYFIFTDNLSLLVKMDATHLCFSLPFMSGIPWIAKPDKVVHCRVFQLPPSTAPPFCDGQNRGISGGICGESWQAGVRAVRQAPLTNTNQPWCSFTIHI